jgi:phage recombination protein Bet
MNAVVKEQAAPRGIIADMALQYGMDAVAFERTMRATVFPAEASKEQFAAFLLVAREYKLNPLTKQIYAFPDKRGGVAPIVPIDGWMSIINSHPQFDGMEFKDEIIDGALKSITCSIHRKDRTHPTCVTEYMSECLRGTDPWKQWPARMLRHKAAIQCARYAFSLSGIHDPDEAERIIEKDVTPVETTRTTTTRTAAVAAKLRPQAEPIEAVVERQEPAVTLAHVVGYIEKAKDRDVALQALDLANALPEEERVAAKQEFDKRFPEGEQ